MEWLETFGLVILIIVKKGFIICIIFGVIFTLAKIWLKENIYFKFFLFFN